MYGFLAGAVAAAACYLAIPAAGARLAELRGNPAVEALRRGEGLTGAGYRRVVSSREGAAHWQSEPKLQKDLAMAMLLATWQARRADSEVLEVIEQASVFLEDALAAAPADPQALTQLAWSRARLGDLERAAAALKLSYRLGPVMPELAVTRTALGMGMWQWLAPVLQDEVAAEFGLALAQGGEAFVRSTLQRGLADTVRQRLAATPAAAERFDEWLGTLEDAAEG